MWDFGLVAVGAWNSSKLGKVAVEAVKLGVLLGEALGYDF
jgi:hypothetical protein